ncbi:hypothetical protein L9F63_002668, partial [Diploptera punctata]
FIFENLILMTTWKISLFKPATHVTSALTSWMSFVFIVNKKHNTFVIPLTIILYKLRMFLKREIRLSRLDMVSHLID